MFGKSIWSWKKDKTKKINDRQNEVRNRTIQAHRDVSLPVRAEQKKDNEAAPVGLSRAQYMHLLMCRLTGFTSIDINSNKNVSNDVEKNQQQQRSDILAAQTKRVEEYSVSLDEGKALEQRIKDEMEKQMNEPPPECSSSNVFGDEEGMDVEEEDNQQAALIAGRKTDLGTEEREAILRLLRMSPNSRDVVIDKFNIDITVSKLICLKPNTWLNDEIVNFYMCMLQERDQKLCAESKNKRLPSHYFNSFFVSKLLENGQYDYAKVRRWSKKFDVFTLDRVFMPINLNNTHWVMSVVYVQKKEVHYYDSMSGSGKRYLEAILRWLTDEAREKKQFTLDPLEWKLIDREKGVPQQQNGYDCGVFSIVCADYLTDYLPLVYEQKEMSEQRLKIAAAIKRGHLMY